MKNLNASSLVVLTSFLVFSPLLAFCDTKSPSKNNTKPISKDNECLSDNVYLTVDYLYWEAQQDQLLYINTLSQVQAPGQGNSPASAVDEIKFKEQKFRYSSGFKVGIGYNAVPFVSFPWDFYVNWTRFHQHSTAQTIGSADPKSTSGLISPLIQGWLNNDVNHVVQASSNWRIHFDTIDLELGKKYSSKCLISWKPYLGIRGAVINQIQKIVYGGVRDNGNTDLVAVSIKRKNDFSGIGPRLGINSDWMISKQFALFGNLSGSLLYGRFDLKDHLFFDEPVSSEGMPFNNSPILLEKLNRLRPTVQGILGLKWGMFFGDCRHVEISAAYETQYWWDQWQHNTSAFSFFSGFQSWADLSLHGLTVSARMDF